MWNVRLMTKMLLAQILCVQMNDFGKGMMMYIDFLKEKSFSHVLRQNKVVIVNTLFLEDDKLE